MWIAAAWVAVAAIVTSSLTWANGRYKKIAAEGPINVDEYINLKPSLLEKLQCVMLRASIRRLWRINDKPYNITTYDSKYVKDLKITKRADPKEPSVDASNKSGKKKPPLIIGTIRMGFGHMRIGYGAVSWAVAMSGSDRDVYLHDFVSINSGEADLLDSTEGLYSIVSRFLTESPRPIGNFMASLTKGGDANIVRKQFQVASMIRSVLSGLDKDSPVVATHPLVGCVAVAAGFKTVINLVVDNHPQWFSVTPGALNVVQGPATYNGLVKLGVPPKDLVLAGHWCPKEMVDTIEEASRRRISRLQNKKPLRLLIPVGGAGAQRSFLCKIIATLSPLVKEGKLQLFLNAGDHDHIDKAFRKQLQKSNLNFKAITTVEDMRVFREKLWSSEMSEPEEAVTLFAYNNTYGAVATTDELGIVSDVLVCKPSELAFYALPKLMIRRVGDHEQRGAHRAAELGDGTLEARTIDSVLNNVEAFLKDEDILINMNKALEKNKAIGLYDGCKVAVEMALEMSA